MNTSEVLNHKPWWELLYFLNKQKAILLTAHFGNDISVTSNLKKNFKNREKKPNRKLIENPVGVPWWLSGLRIWHCHCYSSGGYCGTGSIFGLGTLGQKEKANPYSSLKYTSWVKELWMRIYSLCVIQHCTLWTYEAQGSTLVTGTEVTQTNSS